MDTLRYHKPLTWTHSTPMIRCIPSKFVPPFFLVLVFAKPWGDTACCWIRVIREVTHQRLERRLQRPRILSGLHGKEAVRARDEGGASGLCESAMMRKRMFAKVSLCSAPRFEAGDGAVGRQMTLI